MIDINCVVRFAMRDIMKVVIEKQVLEHQSVIGGLIESCIDSVEQLGGVLLRTLETSEKLIVFGNGGSAADAQHFVCELVGSFQNKERRPLPAIALTTNTSSLTSISNDFSYADSFRRQIEALAKPGDLCLGISTSGNSQNVFDALVHSRELRCVTAALLGNDGGKIKDIVDYAVIVPSDSTPRIQEVHILIIHILCKIVDDAFSPQ